MPIVLSGPTAEENRTIPSYDTNGREVCIYTYDPIIPEGYIVMSITDVKNNRSECNSKLGEWDIVSL